MFCSDVVSHGCLEQMVRNGISMGVGLRPKAKAMEKPPNPKESLWTSLVLLLSGRSDLGGEQNRGPEHEGMTALSKWRPCRSRSAWVRR